MRMRLGQVAWILAIATPPCLAQSALAIRSSSDILLPVAGPAVSSPVSRVTASRSAPIHLVQASPGAPVDIAPIAPVVSPKFEIRRYLTEGNMLLTQERIHQVLAPFTGMNKDFGDVQRALEALQGAYQTAGYGGVEIRLPEQELKAWGGQVHRD